MKKIVLSIVFVLTAITVGAQSLAYIYDDATKTATVTYNVDENKNRIVYPSTLTAIPEKAPNGYRVTAIGSWALAGCKTTELTIPASVVKIEDNAVNAMSNLKKLVFADGSETLFIGVDNIIATGGMFNGASVMEEIYVERNLTYDEEKAVPLYGGSDPPSHSLLKAVIGEKVTRIPYGLFNDCRKLNDVTIGSNVIEIGERAFWGCISLESIVLPDGLTVIKPRTFANCSSLISIQLPPNLVELGEEALYGCSALEEITIPGTIETFGNRAFIYSGLKRIAIADSNGSCYMPYGLFSGTKLTDFYMGKNVTFKDASNGPFSGSIDYQTTDFVIGSLVTKIGDGFFVRGGGQYAVNVRFGSSVKTIGSDNFRYASNMATITSEATEPPVCADEKTIFTNVNKETCQLIVPATSIEAYKNAPVWKEFFNIQALPETKCATPTASIVDGKLVFQCITEGAEFHCEYDYPKGGKADGNNIVVSQALTMRVYATKAGLDNSDVATYQLVLGSGTDLAGDANRDGVINAADIVTIVNIIMGK